jgi:hypothetical protein
MSFHPLVSYLRPQVTNSVEISAGNGDGWSRDSSVSIVSGYGLDDRAIDVRFSAEARDLSLTSVSRPALGYLGVKFGRGCDVDNSPPSSTEVVNE